MILTTVRCDVAGCLAEIVIPGRQEWALYLAGVAGWYIQLSPGRPVRTECPLQHGPLPRARDGWRYGR